MDPATLSLLVSAVSGPASGVFVDAVEIMSRRLDKVEDGLDSVEDGVKEIKVILRERS
jgi:hypothetical protein